MKFLPWIAACCICLTPFASADNDDDDLPMGGIGGTCHVVAGQPILVVKSLIAGAPGDVAGLELGDFITAVHGRALGTTPVSSQRFSEGYKGAVQDFGIGIAPENHSKIFDRFFRAAGKDEKTFPGFGIGLFIVNEILSLHNGKIWVESEKDKGSTFYFSLPVYTKQ